MADQLLQKVQDTFEGQIDFEGQKLTEQITTFALAATGLAALIVGLIQQNIQLTLWVGLGGTALTFLVTVPPWPMYNNSPERWLPSGSNISGSGIEVDGRKIN